MIYSSDDEGEATFTLSKSEHEAFKRGEPIIKKTGDRHGNIKIILQMSRPVKPTVPLSFNRAANTIRRSYGNKMVVKVGLEDNDGSLMLVVRNAMGDCLFTWDTGEQGDADPFPYLTHIEEMNKALNTVGIQVATVQRRTC